MGCSEQAARIRKGWRASIQPFLVLHLKSAIAADQTHVLVADTEANKRGADLPIHSIRQILFCI